VEPEAISQPDLEQIEQLGSSDLVIGILDGDGQHENKSAVAVTLEALAPLSQPLRAMVVCSNFSQNGSHSGAHDSAAAVTEVAESNQLPKVVSCSLPLPGPGETPQQSISNAYRRVFAIGGKLGARACAVITSPQAVTHQWIYRLVQPVLDLGFDLVAPCYTRQKMEGLLNRSILAPLHRALYGEQLQNPMGPDFGISGKLLQQVLRRESGRRGETGGSALASIASAAASGGFQVCESYLGVRAQLPTDPANLSGLLAEVLGPMFLEMEGRAAYWQSIRGSQTVPKFGAPEPSPPETGQSRDVQGMIESFQLGTQNLQDVWGLILPPATLMELKKLSRAPQTQFRLPDAVWVRIVYDFALGHRLRTISRDHLLRSITPLYLGWIASYALETDSPGFAEVDSRIERLAKAYEDNKSYLVSRWRWPDRFNP
jgi:glucosylglycerate synthase